MERTTKVTEAVEGKATLAKQVRKKIKEGGRGRRTTALQLQS